MYGPERIAGKLKAAELHLGWKPEYHSIEEVERFNAHMKTLLEVDDKRNINLTRDLNKKEKWWVRNERAISYADEQYWATRYAKIFDAKNNIIPYKPRPSQLVLHRIFGRLDDRQVSIEAQILKGRQQGTSTEIEIKFAHRLLHIPGTQAICASADGQKSELMTRMFYTVIDNLPWWQVPQVRKNRRSGARGLLEFHTGSVVAIQSGAQETGLGQGWTPTLCHISECCDYGNPQLTIEEGLMKATHSSAALFAVYESTGNGNTGWWADTWRSSKEFYPRGEARLMPIFIPWHMATDLFPEADWLLKFPVQSDWRPSKETIMHANKCRAYVKNTPILWEELGLDWELPREQMWFWEFNFKEASRKNAAKGWLRQMPADDFEALSGKNDSVFGSETIEVIGEASKKNNFKVYGIIGEGIDEEHEPMTNQVDYEAPRVPVTWMSPRGEEYEWLLIPLLPIDVLDEQTAMGKLLIFEDPIDGCDYSAAGDTADGVGGDRSVINMNRIGRDEQPDVQVAEFSSDRISTAQASAFMAAICARYAPCVPGWAQPLMAIEQRRKPGDDCQNQLIRMGFRRHFKFHRLDGKNPDEDERRSQRLGWYTNEWSRPYMFGRFINGIENNWYQVHSPYLVKEMSSLEKKHMASGRSRMEHMQGMHDDRVFAAGISYVIAHTKDVLMERSKKRYQAPQNKLPQLDLSNYNPFAFKVSDSRETFS